MQLVPADSVTEALETDNLALQNMSGSKYVQVTSRNHPKRFFPPGERLFPRLQF